MSGKIIKVESCFMCTLSDVSFDYKLSGRTLIVACGHDNRIGEYGEPSVTGMGTEGIWDKCPLEDYEDSKN